MGYFKKKLTIPSCLWLQDGHQIDLDLLTIFRTSMDPVDICRICLVIQTQNKADVSISAVELFDV